MELLKIIGSNGWILCRDGKIKIVIKGLFTKRIEHILFASDIANVILIEPISNQKGIIQIQPHDETISSDTINKEYTIKFKGSDKYRIACLMQNHIANFDPKFFRVHHVVKPQRFENDYPNYPDLSSSKSYESLKTTEGVSSNEEHTKPEFDDLSQKESELEINLNEELQLEKDLDISDSNDKNIDETPFTNGYYWEDNEYRELCAKYYQLLEEVESDYSVIYNLNLFDSFESSLLMDKCDEVIGLLQKLMSIWAKYEVNIPFSCDAFKRLSMLKEKQEDYQSAADACLKAIKCGIYNDGTPGGYRGRLARMIKKGNLYVTEEMDNALSIK